jgi:hypothetical protein
MCSFTTNETEIRRNSSGMRFAKPIGAYTVWA